MDQHPAAHTGNGSDSRPYRICIDSVLDPRWGAWFEGMTLIQEADHTVVLTGYIDQAALYGVIAKLRNLGLTLISIARDPEPA